MSFIDFDALKEQVSVEDAIFLLDLSMKKSGSQWRGECPGCRKGGPRALSITPSRQMFYCFGDTAHGDVIALVAHVKGLPMKQAAQWLLEQSQSPATVPQEPRRVNQTKKLEPLKHLDAHHEAVLAVGFDPAIAETIGIGYCSKGLMAGHVAIPVRDEDGALLGYVGIQEAKLPKDFQPADNVIPLKRKA